jgi:hypothetical protein
MEVWEKGLLIPFLNNTAMSLVVLLNEPTAKPNIVICKPNNRSLETAKDILIQKHTS